MLREVQENIYQLTMAMPESRVKSINQVSGYIIKGENGARNLLIDTGLNQDSCLKPVLEAYEELGISQEDTDAFVTHTHFGNSGLIGRLKNNSNKIIIEAHEAELIKAVADEAYWEDIYDKYREEGLPMDYREYRDSHPAGENYCVDIPDIFCVNEGNILEYGSTIEKKLNG